MHHSSQPDPEIQKLMREAFGEHQQKAENAAQFFRDAKPEAKRRAAFGATGEFPGGKFTPADEGEIRFGVTSHNGKVIVDFGKPVVWMGMDAAQARGLAEVLLKRADEAEAQ